MRLGRWLVLAIGIAASACASTIGPVVPSIQVLVVLDSMDDTLRIIPVDSPKIVHKVVLGIAAFNKHALAVSGPVAAIGAAGTAYAVSLTGQRVICTASGLGAGAITALAFDDNGLVYAAIPSTNGTPHFDPTTQQAQCAGGGGTVRGGPQGFVSARGILFVVVTGDKPNSPSWLSTNTGQSDNTPLSLQDSIPLSLPGHAQGAVLASDGYLYVINAGSGTAPNARLSQVDPVQRVEQNVYNGFGTAPQYIATDGDRIFVASQLQGLMVFNTRTKQLERDFNSAIPLSGAPRGLAADDVGRVYALIAGPCNASGQGSISVFGTDLVSQPSVPVGRCPIAIGVTDIPATLYHFDN